MSPAPGLLSAITGWPSCLASGSAMTRATMSLAPPVAEIRVRNLRAAVWGPVG